MPQSRSPEVLTDLAQLDTCTASNAVEVLSGRPRNEGFMGAGIRCQFPHLPPMAGYAVTGRLRSSDPPIAGGWYYDRMDWWNYVLTMPEPRIIVMQSMDEDGLAGAWFGEIHANICRAIGCVGYVTDGSVRDLEAVEAIGFPLFARGSVVSHSYAHLTDFGGPVEVGGVTIRPGDLLHGDRNGVHLIPAGVAEAVPRTAADLKARETRFIEFCRSKEFSVAGMDSMIQDLRAHSADGRRR